MHRSILILLALAVPVCRTGAVETATWRQSEYADFEKGNLKKLSLRSDGRLSLAPVFTEILDSSTPYLWALAEDSKGNLYAGGGGPGSPGARVHVISPDGQSRVLAELDGLEVHALAVDRKDQLYAATSPDGKVYRIGEGAKPEVFYDPGAKYIWALAFDAKGDLFVATGDQGLIHRVTPSGKGGVFFRTEETHARSLAIDGKGNLIVGTEPGGLILRVSPSGEGFVLHQAPKREITAVSVGKDGSIYAAGVGIKQPAPAPSIPPPPPPAPAAPASAATASSLQAQQAPAQAPASTAPPPATISGGSEVYRIESGGYARKIWSHARDIVYAIALDGEGRPLVGTGNKGAVYQLDSDVLYTVLVAASPTQVTSLYAGRQGRVYAATGNVGKVYRIGPEIEKEGSLESEVFDSGLFSLWGRLMFQGDANGGILRFETRSGNLDRPRKDWSPWAAVKLDADGGRVLSPQARFVQWRLTLQAASTGRSPDVQSVYVAYLPKNVAPLVESIEITPANYRFPAQSLSLTPSRSITLQPMGRARKSSPPAPVAESGVVTMQYEKGQIGARWAASDENGDGLLYKVEIRGVQESEWKLLKDKVKEKHLSWDSTAYQDGDYLIRVTAADSPDNPPGQELSSQLVSESFLIDNTPPEIAGLAATRTSGTLEVRWKAKDASSLIHGAEYSLDGGEWLVIEPTTKVSDSPGHDYVLTLERVSPGEHTIAVRVSDDYDNQSVAKTVTR
jgi:sugar lactone lactonase YvrE